MTNLYNWAKIRALLVKGFSESELRTFIFDESDFEDVYNQLSQGTGKYEIVQLLLDHAKRKSLIEHLLTWAKEHNPAMYEKYQPFHDIGQSERFRTLQNPTQAQIEDLNRLKERFQEVQRQTKENRRRSKSKSVGLKPNVEKLFVDRIAYLDNLAKYIMDDQYLRQKYLVKNAKWLNI